MPETGNNNTTGRQRLTIRIGEDSLSFSAVSPSAENQIVYWPYGVRSGMSMAANLREALKVMPFGLEQRRRALVLLGTPVMFVPADEFAEGTKALFYTHTMTGQDDRTVLSTVIPELNAVAVYSVNRDLKTVADDNFEDVRYSHTCVAVTKVLYRRSFAGLSRRLFCHFGDGRLNIYSFGNSRIRFANSYEAASPRDAVYFMLHVWQMLALDRQRDELHITGEAPDRDMLAKELQRYVRNVCMISPKAEFNRSPVTGIKDMPYDLMAHYAGR